MLEYLQFDKNIFIDKFIEDFPKASKDFKDHTMALKAVGFAVVEMPAECFKRFVQHPNVKPFDTKDGVELQGFYRECPLFSGKEVFEYDGVLFVVSSISGTWGFISKEHTDSFYSTAFIRYLNKYLRYGTAVVHEAAEFMGRSGFSNIVMPREVYYAFTAHPYVDRAYGVYLQTLTSANTKFKVGGVEFSISDDNYWQFGKVVYGAKLCNTQ